jgi:putative transposase
MNPTKNARLKRLVTELSVDKAVLQDVLAKKFQGQHS